MELTSSHKDEPMDIEYLSFAIHIFISVPERVAHIDDHDDLFLSPESAQDDIANCQTVSHGQRAIYLHKIHINKETYSTPNSGTPESPTYWGED